MTSASPSDSVALAIALLTGAAFADPIGVDPEVSLRCGLAAAQLGPLVAVSALLHTTVPSGQGAVTDSIGHAIELLQELPHPLDPDVLDALNEVRGALIALSR